MIVVSPLCIKIKVIDMDCFSFTLLLWIILSPSRSHLVTVIRKSPPLRTWHKFPSQWVYLVYFYVDKAGEEFISSPFVFPPGLTSELQCSPPPPKTRWLVFSSSLFPPICFCHLSQSHSPVVLSLRSLHLDQSPFQLTYLAVGVPFHFKDKPTLLYLRLF